jgi:hypothetical protein
MKLKTQARPTAAELEILNIIWAHGPSTVRFVNDRLSEEKWVGYTTTLKIMQIMAEKGLLERDESRGRPAGAGAAAAFGPAAGPGLRRLGVQAGHAGPGRP